MSNFLAVFDRFQPFSAPFSAQTAKYQCYRNVKIKNGQMLKLGDNDEERKICLFRPPQKMDIGDIGDMKFLWVTKKMRRLSQATSFQTN